MKKILITGANGMIGSALTKSFIDKYELILVDSYTNRIDKYRNKAKVINRSLAEILEWQEALNDVYCVVHLAAAVHWVPKTKEQKQQFIRINAEDTRKLYKACVEHKVERFLFFSTNDVYASSDKLITEDTFTAPQSVYGKSKLIAEQYLLEDSKRANTAVCIFRPASVYGENDKGSMKTLITLCRKGIVPMIGDGAHKKALLYLKDTVQAVVRYIECKNNHNGEIFNLSSGNFEYKEIIDIICSVFNFKPFRLFVPKWFCKQVASKIGPLKKLDIASDTKIVSCHRANRLLNYQSQYDLISGLKDSKLYYTKVIR